MRAAQVAPGIRLTQRMNTAFAQREPLAVRALLVGITVMGIHLFAPRLGLTSQLAQDLANLADPVALILLVASARKRVTPVAAPRHSDGRRLVPAE